MKWLGIPEVAEATGFDAQSIRTQIHKDMENGRNDQNFHALIVGNRIKIPEWVLEGKQCGNGELKD